MSDDLADWMGNLPEHLHTAPLHSLAIPGSHDSFSNFLDKDGPVAPNEPEALTELAKMFGDAMKDIIYKWSKTQNYTPSKQLEAGIRYFDVRLSTKAGCDGYYITHGLYGLEISSILTEINNFLENHPKEIIFLDFNHLYGMKPEDHMTCMELIQKIFGEKLCPFLGTESLCLETLWQNQLQVIVFYHDVMAMENMMFWPASMVRSPWANVSNTSKLFSWLQANYEHGRPADKFYVTQGILTPDLPFILAHLGGSLEANLADKVTQPFIDWLKTKQCGLLKGINICIMDFACFENLIPVVVKLNSKAICQ